MFSVPLSRDRHFIERKDILLQGEEQLRTDFQAALCGIGGIGYNPRLHFVLLLLTNAISKTQIAIEYAYKYRETHPSSNIFLVYTASSVRFVQAYQDIAQRLELPGYDVNNLGLAFDKQGKYQEAEEMYRQTLEGSPKVAGVEPPHTLVALVNLAVVLRHERKFEESETFFRQSLLGYERTLGAESPEILRSLWQLANLLRDQKRYSEAEDFYTRANKGATKHLGPEHPRTIDCVEDHNRMISEMRKANGPDSDDDSEFGGVPVNHRVDAHNVGSST